ncbi:glycosyltransferase [Pontibacter akesuensis]|uniref:glycosyltransferase n=1 Tax=Pontibacter akesuensis TaxID=388950 RepID=UPI00167B6D45|nr:glycosyltransferase [Pontibacter akesuensis]
MQQLSSRYTDINIGVSNWGQNRSDLALQAKDHLHNLKKLFAATIHPQKETLRQNHAVYYHPTFTWTQHIAQGNLEGVVKANLSNLKAFEADFGPVDLIHAQTARPAGIIAKRLSDETGIPFCITEHTGPFPDKYSVGKDGKLKPALKLAYDSSAQNIAESHFQKQRMQAQGISRVTVIPNFVEEDFFKCSLKSDSRAFRFFSLGYIHPKKGFDTLLAAFKLVVSEYESASLTIGGTGEYLETYRQLTADAGILDKVSWLGEINREEALHQYQNCDAFVLASQYEALGNVFLEAIACGKPIIATKCGAPEETVNETNGVAVEKNNPEALSKAMLYLINNIGKYDSRQIRQDFMSRFSSQAVMPQLYSLYKNISSLHPRQR